MTSTSNKFWYKIFKLYFCLLTLHMFRLTPSLLKLTASSETPPRVCWVGQSSRCSKCVKTPPPGRQHRHTAAVDHLPQPACVKASFVWEHLKKSFWASKRRQVWEPLFLGCCSSHNKICSVSVIHFLWLARLMYLPPLHYTDCIGSLEH